MELYLHLPFCRSKCRYCDFASYPGREDEMARYCQCLMRELAGFSPVGQPLETIFIGGGTPSLVPPRLLAPVLQAVASHFRIQPGAEFTCEANPGTLTPDFLAMLREAGCNRLSLGAQAAQPALLKTLGRIHTWAEVEASVGLARETGFDNLSLDLMFGLPGQTLAQWEETLSRALALAPRHLSCYGLIVEEGTPFFSLSQHGRLLLPDEETERAMYDRALHLLAQAGLQPYELSNFAQPGYECRHNLGYWRQTPYLGLGAAAHSLLPCARAQGAYLRRGNTPSLDAYMAGVEAGRPVYSEHTFVSPEEAQFETLMLGLRTLEGVSEKAFEKRHGVPLAGRFGPALSRLERQGLLRHENGAWRLSRRGMDVQNAVLVSLMPD